MIGWGDGWRGRDGDNAQVSSLKNWVIEAMGCYLPACREGTSENERSSVGPGRDVLIRWVTVYR